MSKIKEVLLMVDVVSFISYLIYYQQNLSSVTSGKIYEPL